MTHLKTHRDKQKIKKTKANKVPRYNKRYLEGVSHNRTKIFEMSSSGKFVLCLAVVLCVIQATSARPRLDGNFLENVKYDLVRKCAGLEKDFQKDEMNVRHKLMKESMKLMKKAVKEGSPECVESAKLQAEEQLEEKVQEIQECIQEVRDAIDSGLQPEAGLPEIMAFRADSKNKLQACKKTGKMDLKAIQNNFSIAGKACLM